MEWNELEKIRLGKIDQMRAQNVEPYPTRTEVDHAIKQAIDTFASFENEMILPSAHLK